MRNRQTKIERDKRLKRLPKLTELYIKGVSIDEIAKRLGVNRGTVDKDLHLARKIWRREAGESRELHIACQLKRLDLIESEAWAAWDRSTNDAEFFAFEIDIDDEEILTKNKNVRHGQCGDPRLLEVALKCVDRRCQMLKAGHYAKVERGLGDVGEDESMQATIVEIEVENGEQAEHMMTYDEYMQLIKPSNN